MVDPIVVAAGTALVSAMATEVWQQARASVVALWRRVHPQQADTVEADLEGLRAQVLDARQAGRADTESIPYTTGLPPGAWWGASLTRQEDGTVPRVSY